MPETFFKVRWPSGETSDCYSPSTVVREFFQAGQDLTVDDFVKVSREALSQASERVRIRYGYSCSSAMDQLREIRLMAGSFQGSEIVRIIRVG